MGGPMKTHNARDSAVTGAIFGLAGAAWFGWAQASPPAGWSIGLTVGSIASLLIMVGCGLLALRHRRGQTAMADPRVRRGYNLTVAAEAVACLAGAAALGSAGRPAYIPAWVLLVVGVHFVPLARLFAGRDLLACGVVLIVVSVVAALAGHAGIAAPSTVAGGGAGLVLAACAVVNLRRAYLAPIQTAAVGGHAG
jgi:hypothetical protein